MLVLYPVVRLTHRDERTPGGEKGRLGSGGADIYAKKQVFHALYTFQL